MLLSLVVYRIYANFYTKQTYRTAVFNNHNTQQLKFVFTIHVASKLPKLAKVK